MNKIIKNILVATAFVAIGTMPFSAHAVNRLFYGQPEKYDFFEYLTRGFVPKQKNGIFENMFKKPHRTTRIKNYQRFGLDKKAGKFSNKSLGELKRLTKYNKPLTQPGFFKILYDTSAQEIAAGTAMYNGIKINARNSAFQSASTHYSVEGGMYKEDLVKGAYINQRVAGALKDGQKFAAQGETIAAMFAYMTFDLHYIAFAPTLDLLKDVPYLKNPGHKQFNSDKLKKDNGYDKIRIGYMKNTALAFEADPNPYHNFVHHSTNISFPRLIKATNEKRNYRYDVIKSFAINLTKYEKIKKYKKTYEQTVKAAKQVLNATYEGALRAAYLNGAKNIFLTLVGGGSFKNPINWIKVAIEKALLKFGRQYHLNIYLVIPKKEDTSNRFWKNLEYGQKTKQSFQTGFQSDFLTDEQFKTFLENI